ncbi:hypothetical protein CDD82_2779 [Ophiocordyceps australis]|uniref:BTB domain-containing protein n=1 Tax=Ophiocordyceps australis TaxID=1399860 RepID=A0A2C5X6Y4_9HYPO|nr:hypothetical protein CDD82_2779 [Ophiocordyceps australis]
MKSGAEDGQAEEEVDESKTSATTDSIFGAESGEAETGYTVSDLGKKAADSLQMRRGSKRLPWGEEAVVRFRVSSECLLLKSKYFFKMLHGPWKENTGSCQARIIYAHDWNQEALAIVMCALHGWTAAIPGDIDTELFAQIAVIVDYYQCHAAMAQYSGAWLSKTKKKLPKRYGRKMVLVMMILQVFGEAEGFWEVTARVQRQVTGPLMKLGLPFAPGVQERVEAARQRNVGALVAYMYDSLACLAQSHSGCEARSCWTRVKQLVEHLVATAMYPKPEPPYARLSMAYILDTVMYVEEPAWHTRCFMARMLRVSPRRAPLGPAWDDGYVRRVRDAYLERKRLEDELLATLKWARGPRRRHVHCTRAWHTAPGIEGLDLDIEGLALATKGEGLKEWCEALAMRGGCMGCLRHVDCLKGCTFIV